MWDFLDEVWRFEYAVMPCLFAYLVFDLPIIYRRITRRIYVPIYFLFFPFGYSDEMYARYIDDDFCMISDPFRKDEVTNARYKIIWISVLSLTLTLAISPFLSAMFCYYFLTAAQQTQFIYTLAIVKGSMLLCSLYNLRWQYKITDVVPFGYVATIYAAFWIALLTFFDRGLDWVAEKDKLGGLNAIANNLLDFFVYDIGVGILFVGIIGFLIPWRLTSGTAQPIEDDQLTDEE